MLKIDDLIILQDGLRKLDQMQEMISFVKNKGFFTQEALALYATKFPEDSSSLIAISRFPDDKLYIHDGHHRVTSIHVAGRDYLRDDEFVISDWTYEQYIYPNYELLFLTPFDPKTEVRLADFSQFKNNIKSLILSKRLYFAEQIDAYIKLHENEYKTERIDSHVNHLAKFISI